MKSLNAGGLPSSPGEGRVLGLFSVVEVGLSNFVR